MPGPSFMYLGWFTAVPGNFQPAHPPMVNHESIQVRIRHRGHCWGLLGPVLRFYLPDILYLVAAGVGYLYVWRALIIRDAALNSGNITD